MSKTQLRIASALAALALLGGSAGVAAIASAANEVTTQAATSVTSSNATLNATNGTSAATGSAFWVSSSTITASSSTNPTLPAGVYSTGNLGAVAGSANFSAQLSSAAIPSGFSVSPNTTYHYLAWVNGGGTWFPGADMTVTTGSTTATTSISNIAVSNIGTTSATISWNTNNAGTGTVSYGTTTGYGSTATTSSTASTTQSVTLTNLSPGTLYHFAVTATGGSSTATSSDMTFTTQSTGTTTPLAVTSVDAIKTTATADNTYANGWEWVMHLTVPDNENALRIKFTDWFMNNSSSTSFASNGNMQVWSAQSTNAATSGAALSSGNSFQNWLYLNGDTSSTTPGRQVDLHIMVKIPTGTAAGNYTTTYTAQSWPSSATSTATST